MDFAQHMDRIAQINELKRRDLWKEMKNNSSQTSEKHDQVINEAMFSAPTDNKTETYNANSNNDASISARNDQKDFSFMVPKLLR